tara:strand:+ start:1590 stop:2306 length:717 start_codon:yes stop_codon:yes gene_type:complete
MFVIPMAGLSSRFFKAGYTKPKYQLMLGNETIFSWSIKSFEKYFQTDLFVFIYRDISNTKEFLQEELEKLEVENYKLVCLPDETMGQADTVYQGLQSLNFDESLYIFNIDSKIIDFTKPQWADSCDGYLEVFEGMGEHWSFILTDIFNTKVIRTAEKERISNLCSDGLYYFKSKVVFQKLFVDAMINTETVKNEYYIAPLYNNLIKQDGIVLYDLVSNDRILFCGTPEEYKTILESRV